MSGRRRQTLGLHPARSTGEAFDRAEVELAASTMNKTEAAVVQELEISMTAKEIRWWAFEPLRFRIGKGAFYTPDFVVLRSDFNLQVFEVKGHWEEAARVRIKVAAHLFPWLRFTAVKRIRGGWEFEEIQPPGRKHQIEGEA